MNIRGIAEIAGVSVSTVSRVLNNSDEVKEETREKIMEIMKEYNYIPNNSARNLKRISTKNIGVLVDSRYNPFFYEIINIISQNIKDNDYSMILQYMDSEQNDMVFAREFIKEKKLSGLICVGLDFLNLKKEQIRDILIPIVSVSSVVGEDIRSYVSSVTINDFNSAYSAVNLLIESGHREIGIIASKGEFDYCGRVRMDAFENAMNDNGIKIKKPYVEYADYTFETAYKAMKKIIARKKMPTAMFVISDIMAIGAIKACMDNNIKVPDDVSVIGFDGIETAKYYHPSITTVKQPYEYMAAESVSIIMELINEKSKNRHINFDVKIIERESVAKLVTV